MEFIPREEMMRLGLNGMSVMHMQDMKWFNTNNKWPAEFGLGYYTDVAEIVGFHIVHHYSPWVLNIIGYIKFRLLGYS